MASIRKHPKSRFWYACITLPDGKQKQFSTGIEDEDEARAVAVAAERSACKMADKPHQLREALDRLANDFIPPVDFQPGPWLMKWAESRKNECETSTAEAYASTATEAAKWMRANNVTKFSELTAKRVTELRDYWVTRNAGSTVNNKLKHLRIALKVAVREKLIDASPTDGVLNVKAKKTVRREFRAAELKILIPSLEGEWRALFFLGLHTGQRLNDLAVLRWSAVDLVNKTVTFHAKKTDALVCLPLMAEALETLAELPNSGSPDDFILTGIAAMKRTLRSNTFREKLAEVGLANHVSHQSQGKNGKRETSPLSFHSLRHTLTSMLKSSGVSDSIARAIVGHESVAVSQAYTHLDMATMRKALEQIPKI